MKQGDTVEAGDVVGTVHEYHIEHKIMVPPNVSGTVTKIASGEFTVEDTVCILDQQDQHNTDAEMAGANRAGLTQRSWIPRYPCLRDNAFLTACFR